MAVAVGRVHGIGLAQRGDTGHQPVPAADEEQRDRADDDDAEGHQDALQGVGISHGAQPPGGHVAEDHNRQDPHAELDTNQSVRQDTEEKPGGQELKPHIRHRKEHRHHHDKQADQIGVEIIGQHFARGDEPEALSQDPLPL